MSEKPGLILDREAFAPIRCAPAGAEVETPDLEIATWTDELPWLRDVVRNAQVRPPMEFSEAALAHRHQLMQGQKNLWLSSRHNVWEFFPQDLRRRRQHCLRESAKEEVPGLKIPKFHPEMWRGTKKVGSMTVGELAGSSGNGGLVLEGQKPTPPAQGPWRALFWPFTKGPYYSPQGKKALAVLTPRPPMELGAVQCAAKKKPYLSSVEQKWARASHLHQTARGVRKTLDECHAAYNPGQHGTSSRDTADVPLIRVGSGLVTELDAMRERSLEFIEKSHHLWGHLEGAERFVKDIEWLQRAVPGLATVIDSVRDPVHEMHDVALMNRWAAAEEMRRAAEELHKQLPKKVQQPIESSLVRENDSERPYLSAGVAGQMGLSATDYLGSAAAVATGVGPDFSGRRSSLNGGGARGAAVGKPVDSRRHEAQIANRAAAGKAAAGTPASTGSQKGQPRSGTNQRGNPSPGGDSGNLATPPKSGAAPGGSGRRGTNGGGNRKSKRRKKNGKKKGRDKDANE